MKTLLFLSVICFFLLNTVSAQSKQANISFDVTDHDFGNIKEEGGPVTFTFEFTNTGGEPLVINNSKASCGCTTPEWTKSPVLPGQKGFVKATYDPKNRPGKFNKTVTVSSNAENPSVVLHIMGEVSAKVKTLEDIFPQKIGDLRLKTNHLAFVEVFNNSKKTDSLLVVNVGTENLKIDFKNVPQHITIKAQPEVLKPNQKGLLVATYDGSKRNDWGFVMDRVSMVLNDKSEPNFTISISATIKEDFSKLSKEELDKAPSINFESTTFEFGTIKQGASVDYEFKFKNEGKSDLVIRKTKAACGCTAVNPPVNVIKPGETSSIKVKFNSAGKSGKQNKTVTVTTNDPKNNSILLNIKGMVEASEPNK